MGVRQSSRRVQRVEFARTLKDREPFLPEYGLDISLITQLYDGNTLPGAILRKVLMRQIQHCD